MATYTSKKAYMYGTGRRKSSVARVHLFPNGTGSITYKLKLNGGDMKSVQGDSGHAQVKMVADVYSHIIDEDRCINAQRLEKAFYSSKTPDPVEDTEPETADTAVTESDESDAVKILELLKNPETAALLKQLAKAL